MVWVVKDNDNFVEIEHTETEWKNLQTVEKPIDCVGGLVIMTM